MKKLFIDCLAKEWNVTMAAAKLGVTRQAVYMSMDSDLSLKRAVQAVKDAWLDKSEEVIIEYAATGKNITANIFGLKTQRPQQWEERAQIDINQNIIIGIHQLYLTRY